MNSLKILGTLLFSLVMTMPAEAKNGRTFYTDAKLAVMRSNVEKYEWARKTRDGVIAAAERWAKYPDEKLRTLVVPPQVPRAYEVHNMGCPIHGLDINKEGLYHWIIDFEKPFKIKCPVGGEEYPSNDFARFLASGMKDRSLLTGGYADDGWGWNKPPDNRNYWFVAYYAHWSMRSFLLSAIRSLATATVVAEDPQQARRFAHKCSLLLWQFAVYYPDYAYEKQSREGKEHNPRYTGKITNMIWEVDTPNACAPAYDAVWPFLREDAELQRLAGLDGAGLDSFIRERLLREAAICITDGSHRIAGNYGAHQRSLVVLAAAMDEKERHLTSQEMVQWVLSNSNLKNYQDMGLDDALENLVYRDGMPPESPGYNYGWVANLAQVAEMLLDVKVNLFKDPRFQKFLVWPFDLAVAGKFTPPIGDTGDMFAGLRLSDASICRLALPFMGDPRLAYVLRQAPGSGGDLFSKPTREILAESPGKSAEPIGLRSFHFPGYGLAILQSGSPANRIALCLSYGSWSFHAHADQLNLLLFSHENPLLCDVGYPEQTDGFNHKLFGFWTNTVAHNTVVVDAVRQGRGPCKLHAYEPNGFAQVVDASAEHAYSGKVSLYRRANILVEVTPPQSYVFDAFYVRGGRQHDLVCMGPQADFSCEPPLGPVQKQGTLAGPDVPYEQFYDDPRLKDKPLGSVRCSGYRGSGFQYLYNVQRAPLAGRAVCEWRLTEPLKFQAPRPWQGIGLRAHVIGDGQEVIACDGRPQGYRQMPKSVKFMLRRRTGENLASNFMTIYEPYKDQTWIKSAAAAPLEPADGQAVAVRMELADGSTHYLFHSLDPGEAYTLDGKITVSGQAACLILDAAGQPARAMLLNGTQLTIGGFTLKGQGLRRSKILNVDYAKGIIQIADPLLGRDTLPGQTVLVAPNTFADCVTVRSVIDATHFSIGDEDLRVGGGPVNRIVPEKNRIVTSALSPQARPGMTVLNARLEPQGKLATGDPWSLDRGGLGPLKAEDFPSAEGGVGPRFAVVMAGPGDDVLIPSLALFRK